MKQVFNIGRDVLGRVWYRESYSVTADSFEDAYQKMIHQAEVCKNDPTALMDDDEDIEFNESLPLDETYEELSPTDVNGDSTIEILDEDKEPIWNNVNGKC